MKRTERHHLKQNDFAHLALTTRDAIQARQREIVWLLVAVIVVAAAATGYYVWRSRVEGHASVLLADAIAVEQARIGPPPAESTPAASSAPSFPSERARSQAALTKLKTVADEYPGTRAGLEARYREAATRVTLGTFKEAANSYQMVIDAAGSDFIGQMARLGKAEAQARAGEYDEAIRIYNDLAQQKDDRLVDTVLMQLGRVYRDAGKRAEAEQTFNRLIAEYPASQLSEDARRELETIKKG